jgi:glycerol-3-phosphate dehydrogenase subunit C
MAVINIAWDAVRMSMDECIKCNICQSFCPFSEANELFPGPKYVGPQAGRFREGEQVRSPDQSVEWCSGCRVCNEVCPAGVRIAELNTRAKAQIAADRGIPLRNRLLGRNALLGKLGSYAPVAANIVLHNPFSRYMAEKTFGIARHAPLPHWSTQGTFRDWLNRTQAQRLRSDKKVVYFHNCSTMYYEPAVGVATVLVLEHNGYEVVVPRQDCCGLPMLSNAEFPAAEKYYRRNLIMLTSYVDKGMPILGSSTSCVLTLQEEAPELLDIHEKMSERFTRAVWDVSEWLRDRYEAGELKTDFKPLPQVLPYHAPCQQRAQRVGKPAADLLRLIPGIDLRDTQARCCGLAGTYGYKQEKYETAMKVGQEAFSFIKAQGDDVRWVCSDSEICRWQLQHGTDHTARHPIEFIAAAYGLYDLERRQAVAA